MSSISTLIRREMGAYFLSPIAYIVLAIFLFTSGLAFGLGTFTPGGEASLRALFWPSPWLLMILVFVTPLLTMRLISEELRVGTIETLMTAPVSEVQVVLGKYLGALCFYLVLLAATGVYPLIIGMYGRIDVSLLICHYLGLLLLGGLYLSVGLFFSTCTKHQLIAALVSTVALALFTFASFGLAQVVEGPARAVLQHLSIRDHFDSFGRGIVELNHVVFFLTTTSLFLFLSAKGLEMRRWR